MSAGGPQYERLCLVFFLLSVVYFSASLLGYDRTQPGSAFVLASRSDGFSPMNFFSGDSSGYIGAIGDFNSDKYNDLFIIASNGNSIKLWCWNQSSSYFHYCDVCIGLEEGQAINSIEAADFNYDGKLDLLVQYSEKSFSESDDNYLRLYFGNGAEIIGHVNLTPSVGQVMIVQAESSADPPIPRLLGNWRDSENVTYRAYWTMGADKTWHTTKCMDGRQRFSSPNSNAILDLDGDCAADLFLSTENEHEIWLYDKKSGDHVYSSSIQVAKGQGLITFADVDGDGSVDAIFPICSTEDNCVEVSQIRIVYNLQLPICQFFYSKNCRSSSKLCRADPDFKFPPFETADGENTADVVTIPVGDSDGFHLNSKGSPIPLRLRAADYNLDRFPDLLVPVTSSVTGASRVQLWENVKCTPSTCGVDATRKQRRWFQPKVFGLESLLEYSNSFSAIWVDVGETATYDIVLMYQSNAEQPTYQIQGFRNNFLNGYFIKLLGLNGLCVIDCGVKNLRYAGLYGVNQHGLTFKYTLSDLDTRQVASVVPQLPQSSYHSIQPPYSICGIGRPGNYIDYIYMGVPSNSLRGYFRSWPGIIPNSQVVVIPHPLSMPNSWIMELYISPSGALPWIALVVFISLLLSGIVILVLQYKERREDELEKKRKAHLFSFRAL
ncbi:T-cell immunomodulatory protein [Schistocerca gregaria]|uniref:T-cell immunomodulatory protein n=1 Tax=Schistocerca gregaria TaxID=7010 RepID=UPI00211DBA75|nr:T-cell immunomodulatory protein [Schistocerca gregaria]